MSKSPNDPGSKPNAGDAQATKQRSSRPRPAPKPKAKAVVSESATKDPGFTLAAARPVADAATEKVTAGFKAGQPAPSDLFSVMNDAGVEDAFSTKPPERGHQLAYEGRIVDLAVIHEIDNVKRVAAATS